jgi:xanthine permease XanP
MSSLAAPDESKTASTPGVDVIYRVEDRPPPGPAILAAVQHLLAIFVGIVTPTLVLSGPLELDAATSSYLVGMSLFVSGVATFIQVRPFGPVGSGLLSIQGTSFAFLGPLLAAGVAGGKGTAGLALIFGVCLAGSPIEMVLSRFLHLARRFLTPLVTGTVVTLIGLSLIGVAMRDVAGGAGAKDFGSLHNLGLAGAVLLTVVVSNRSRSPNIRMGSIVAGLVVGYFISYVSGLVDFSALRSLPAVNVPIPFRYGLRFEVAAFVPVALLYVITTVESMGDLTATSMISGEPIEGELYLKRIRGGVLGDGFNSMLAAVFNTFPNTTFSQNNGVIQLTGVASRYVGYFIAGFLVLLGIFPVVGGILYSMPRAVLGGATLVMFGTVAAAGIKIISTAEIDGRALMILALSFGLGLGVQAVPDVVAAMPAMLRAVFGSPITTGGLTALVANAALPGGGERGKRA